MAATTPTTEEKIRENYHAYDGTSRSVPLALSDSLRGAAPFTNTVTREDVVVDGARVFLLHGLLSDAECDYLVNSTEAIGFDRHSDVKNEYPEDYRSNQRLIVLSKPLANTMWRRVQPHLHYNDIAHIKPLGWATEGLWLPNQINDGLLFSKYSEGNFFRPHYDGMYKNQYDECSIYSVTVYLNDNYSGGRVLFLKNKDSRDKENILYEFTPKKGTALVFNHDTLHAGEEVFGGVKYIFRTGIMFKHIENLSDPNKGWEQDPLWIKNKEVFKTFTDLGKEGNPEKFTKTFLELQQIQLDHGRSIIPVTPVLLGLTEELLFNVFSALDLKYVLQQAQVCKSWLTIARNGILWRKLYENTWGEASAKYIQDGISGNQKVDPAIQQWYGIYKKRKMFELGGAPMIIYISFDVYGCISKGNDTLYLKPFWARLGIDSSPWDNSYDTYSIGDGQFWLDTAYGPSATHSYAELTKAATYRMNGKDGKDATNPHPFLFITERGVWSKSFEQNNSSYASRCLSAEACAYVEASLCSLYANKLTAGVTVNLEATHTVDVCAWHDLTRVDGSLLSQTVKKPKSSRVNEDTRSAREVAQSIEDMVVESFGKLKAAKGPQAQSVVICEKSTTRAVGKFFHEVVLLLKASLESQDWKVIVCDEVDILQGATVIAGLPAFQENIKWESRLYKEAKGPKIGYGKDGLPYDHDIYVEEEGDEAEVDVSDSDGEYFYDEMEEVD